MTSIDRRARSAPDPRAQHTAAAHTQAVHFLSSITMVLDPAVPPPPLFPMVPFKSAIASLASVSGEEWSYWESLRAAAAVGFLGNIPLGPADDNGVTRRPPVLGLPPVAAVAHAAKAVDGQALPFSGAPSPHKKIAHLTPVPSRSVSVFPTPVPTPASSPPLSKQPTEEKTGGASTTVDFAPADPEPPAPVVGPMLLPLRIQTPPALMGAGTVSASPVGSGSDGGLDGAAAPGATTVGAHLYAHPLMFPSTLGAPLDLSRAATQAIDSADALRSLAVPPLQPRASSELTPNALQLQAQRMGLYDPHPGSGRGRSSRGRGAAAGQQQQPSLDAAGDAALGSVEVDVAADSVVTDGVRDDAGLGGATSLPPSEDPDQSPPQHPIVAIGDQRASMRISRHGLVRSDGIGPGLTDREAFYTAGPRSTLGSGHDRSSASLLGQGSASPPGQAQEDWENDLLDKGILDPRARLVFTSGGPSSSPTTAQSENPIANQGPGSPVMLSSIAAYVARADSSAATTASHTPRAGGVGSVVGGKSRAASFSEALPSAGDGVRGAPSSPIAGQNALLGVAAAALAAHEAQEVRDEERVESSSMFGFHASAAAGQLFGQKRKAGASYAFLLPNSSANRQQHQQQQHHRKGSNTVDGSSPNDPSAGGASNGPAGSPSSLAAAPLSSPHLLNSNDVYDPFFLDDPNVKSGRHRVVLNLPGFMSSLISYVRSKDLKLELNETFALRHEGWLSPTSKMSLSKIRKCKALMLELVLALNLELATAAVAFVYFEKLVLQQRVDKQNRKLQAAVCLLLAYKWSEASVVATSRRKVLSGFFSSCERVFSVSKTAVLKAEFPAFVQLQFDLSVKTEHVLHHFRQILAKLDTVPEDYLDLQWSL